MAARVILICMLTLVIGGCNRQKQDNECPDPLLKDVMPLSGISNQWLQDRLSNKIVYASSNKGRSVSYDISSNTTFVKYNNSQINCTEYSREQRKIVYKSSLYNLYYALVVRNQPDRDALFITTDQHGFIYNVENLPSIYYDLHIQNLTSCRINVYGSDRATVPVTRLDSLTVQNTTHYGVYKIDVLDMANSIDKSRTKVFYIAPRFGIVKVEQFDGEIWEFYR